MLKLLLALALAFSPCAPCVEGGGVMLVSARQIFLGGGRDPMAVVGSVVGDGTWGCVFSSRFSVVPSLASGFTVTCWAKFTSMTRGHFLTIGSDSTGVSLGHGALNDNGVYGDVINGLANSRWWCGTSTSISDGMWHHYGFVLRSNGHKVYVDGVGVNDSAPSNYGVGATNNLNSGSEITLLGVCDGSEPRFLTGNVTRVCVYFGTVKSAAEIAADYALCSKPPDTNGLSHYYNGASQNGQLVDMVGGMNLSSQNGAYISSDKP